MVPLVEVGDVDGDSKGRSAARPRIRWETLPSYEKIHKVLQAIVFWEDLPLNLMKDIR